METERIKEQLKRLSLYRIAEIFEEEAAKASKVKTSYIGFLARLVEEEVLAKTDRSINARIAKAKFPQIKTIEGFDFSFQPSIPEAFSSNKPFEEWGEIFCDDVIASAILDRLLHHSHIIAINGPSYRTKEKMGATSNN